MLRKLLLPLAAVATAATAVAAPVAGAAAPINQGDVIFNITNRAEIVKCTIGYIDHNAGRIYTAGHCGSNGDVFSVDKRTEIGTFTTTYDSSNNRNDNGYITVTDTSLLGQNTFSTDTIANYDDLEAGQMICRYGVSSNKVACGTLFGTVDEQLIMSKELAGISGDSGGPLFAPGQGFIGVYTGRQYLGTADSAGNGKQQREIAYAEGFRIDVQGTNGIYLSGFQTKQAYLAANADVDTAREVPADIAGLTANTSGQVPATGTGTNTNTVTYTNEDNTDGADKTNIAAIVAPIIAVIALLGIGAAAALTPGLAV